MYGWKGKIGLLVPAGNRVILPEFYKVSPPGIAFFETRMTVEGAWISEASNFAMIENAERGLEELKICKVDVCALACTATSFLKGRKWDETFAEEAQTRIGIPVTTTALSLLEALSVIKKKRISLATPWSSEVNRKAIQYLDESGYEIVGISEQPIDRLRVNDQPPEWTYSLARKADRESAEALCIFATDLRSLEILQPLEKILGKPVISSNQAILFNTLRILNYDQTILGYGSLLEQLGVPTSKNIQQGGEYGIR